jgi:hypothetical protein
MCYSEEVTMGWFICNACDVELVRPEDEELGLCPDCKRQFVSLCGPSLAEVMTDLDHETYMATAMEWCPTVDQVMAEAFG